MSVSLLLLVGIALAGIVGFAVTITMVNVIAKVPFKAMWPAYGKVLWSIIFALPLWLLTTGMNTFIAIVVCFLLLSVAPTVASKLYFGPKNRPFMQLMIFNSGYAIAAIVTFLLVLSAR